MGKRKGKAKNRLTEVSGNSYALDDHLTLGVYIDEETRQVTLIDSGIDESKIRMVEKSLIFRARVNSLADDAYTIAAIINTHSHADHCGGNEYVQRINPDVRIFSTGFEKVFIERPELEPLAFNCCAEPHKELKIKHLEAKPSTVTDEIPYEDGEIDILGCPFQIMTLPGHTPGMIAVISPDGVLYSGDSIFGPGTFDKHGVLFYTNIEDTFTSFDKIIAATTDGSLNGFVFYHGGVANVADIPGIVDEHKAKVNDAIEFVHGLLREDRCTQDDLVSAVTTQFGIPQTVTQHALTTTCVKAYLTHLQKNRRLEFIVMADGYLRGVGQGGPGVFANTTTSAASTSTVTAGPIDEAVADDYSPTETSAGPAS